MENRSDKEVGRNILLAEDDDDDAFLLKTAFKRAGYSNPIVRVRNGEEALRYLAGEGRFVDRGRHPFPCLVLLDLTMPIVDGWEVLKRIREHPEWKDLPVVVVTGSSNTEDLGRAYGEGATSFLAKPVDFGDYVMGVRQLGEQLLRREEESVVLGP